MNEEYVIRLAEQQDAVVITQMWSAIDALITHPPFGGNQANHADTQQKIIESTIDSDQGETWVMCHQGQLVATISARLFSRPHVKQSRLAIIYGLWVEPEHRRLGAASALLETVKTYCRLHQVEAIQLAWDACNKDAAEFWQNKGFTPYEVIASQTLD